ncbi:CBS domain-containing protein [Pseudomonas sp. KK4]|uniref:CBS domain-containing protein n=1 Tax=Pseudomonas sp. KK4 TaxID=1855729 RepID=UPI00097C2788|nr:CBS domain-containing protein [Pseudomonas sp. KK4]
MKTVAQLLTSKQKQNLYTIAPHSTVDDALSLMALRNIGALPVVEDGRLTGIVSERDYVRKVNRHGHSANDLQVADIMSSPVLTVDPKQTIRECMALFTSRFLRHLPVVDGGQLIGMLSIGDIVKAMIAEQDQLIEQLEQYIRGH